MIFLLTSLVVTCLGKYQAAAASFLIGHDIINVEPCQSSRHAHTKWHEAAWPFKALFSIAANHHL